MRAKLFLLVGLAAFLVSSTDGLTQPGDRGFQSDKGGFRISSGGRGFGNFDPNELFNRMAGGKDVWSRADTDPRMQGWFDRIAAQIGVTNGQITRQQYLDYSAQRAAERGGRSGFGTPPSGGPASSATPGPSTDNRGGPGGRGNPDSWAEGLFRRLDTNGDGYLNNDEMPEALRSEREKWDTDHNGLIDLNEFKAYIQARMQQSQPDRGDRSDPSGLTGPTSSPGSSTPASPAQEERKPVVYRPGRLPKELPSWFIQLDTDQDAQIGLYEWKVSGRPLEEFQRMDRNQDGFLTVEEVLHYEKERAARSSEGEQGSWDSGREGASGGNWGRDGGFGGPPRGGFGGPRGGWGSQDRGGPRGPRGGFGGPRGDRGNQDGGGPRGDRGGRRPRGDRDR
jgi:Ca2+-binding EF-hand superfamily protein